MPGIYAWFIDEDFRMFYIGQSLSVNEEYRASRLLRPLAEKTSNPHTRNVLGKAKREGKTLSFDWIERYPDDVPVEILNEAESFWIQYFLSIGVHLTNCDGGGGNHRRTAEYRKKASEVRKAVNSNPVTIERHSLSAKRMWKNADYVSRHAVAVKNAMQRPSVRQKQLDGIRHPDTVAKKSTAMKRVWAERRAKK